MSKKIKNLEEYLEEIFRISEVQKKRRPECSNFFRGESQDYKETSCQPGVFRFPSIIKNEHTIYKEFITRNPDEFYKDKLTIDKLTRMQHYRLPTRLLDVSANALLGLFFAVEKEDKNNDALVYVISVPNKIIKFYDSDTLSVISNLAKREKFDFPTGFNKKLEDFRIDSEKIRYLSDFNKIESIKFLLHNIKDEKPYFQNAIHPEHINSIVCVKPLQNNKRIIRQQGMFLLFGNNIKDKYKPASLEDNGIIKDKIIIDKNSKAEIKNNLELIGLTKAVVYPDMQNVAEYLTEKYK
jgi:hypothetical protein